MLKNRPEGATAEAIDSAAARGHLHVVQWLTANLPGLASTTMAMDCAACAGHLNVVKFLHKARDEGCTAEAMDLASKRGHLEVKKSGGSVAYVLFCFVHPIHFRCTTYLLWSPPFRNSDQPLSHSRHSSPLPTTVRYFVSSARRVHTLIHPPVDSRRSAHTHGIYS